MAHRQLVGIDLLRIAAASLVTLFHYGAWNGLVADTRMPAGVPFPELLPAARAGWIGVEIFFVISGFVIASSASGSSATAFAQQVASAGAGGLDMRHGHAAGIGLGWIAADRGPAGSLCEGSGVLAKRPLDRWGLLDPRA